MEKIKLSEITPEQIAKLAKDRIFLIQAIKFAIIMLKSGKDVGGILQEAVNCAELGLSNDAI